MKWTPIVEDNNLRANIENKLEEIFNEILNFKPTDSHGLLGGSAGSFLFLYYYYRYTKQEKHLALLNEQFALFYTKFWKIGHGSLANGYAGICWLIRFLAKEEIFEITDIDNVLSDFDNTISHFMISDIKDSNWDFLHGSLGMAYYFSTITNTKKFDNNLKPFLEFLNKNKVTNSNGGIKWLSNTYINTEKQEMVYNLSLSHGMAALIPFFTKLVKKPHNKLARELLDKTILFYKDSINPSEYKSTFPKWFEKDSHSPSESPLSWCYGDPGIAQALYNAGIAIKDKELSNMALNALIKAANRKDPKSEYVKEACFCHGSSSLCHIYNRLYQKTNMNVFKDTALYWLNDTLEKGKEETKLAGYKFFESPDVTNDIQFLSGLSGVGLSLLATIDTIEPKWDECVLLS